MNLRVGFIFLEDVSARGRCEMKIVGQHEIQEGKENWLNDWEITALNTRRKGKLVKWLGNIKIPSVVVVDTRGGTLQHCILARMIIPEQDS